MLTKTNKIHITCNEFLCKYEWVGTEEDYNKIMQYDGESLNHFPGRRQHKEYTALKEGKCPHCIQHKEAMKMPRPIIRGGVIPSPRYNPRRTI
jgi:hypothetical protein